MKDPKKHFSLRLCRGVDPKEGRGKMAEEIQSDPEV
jgi:hypothetical protein